MSTKLIFHEIAPHGNTPEVVRGWFWLLGSFWCCRPEKAKPRVNVYVHTLRVLRSRKMDWHGIEPSTRRRGKRHGVRGRKALSPCCCSCVVMVAMPFACSEINVTGEGVMPAHGRPAPSGARGLVVQGLSRDVTYRRNCFFLFFVLFRFVRPPSVSETPVVRQVSPGINVAFLATTRPLFPPTSVFLSPHPSSWFPAPTAVRVVALGGTVAINVAFSRHHYHRHHQTPFSSHIRLFFPRPSSWFTVSAAIRGGIVTP